MPVSPEDGAGDKYLYILVEKGVKLSYKFLIMEKDGVVTTLTLNRPEKRNALSRILRGEIIAAMKELEEDDEVKAAILTGSGPVFCAGFDLSEVSEQDRRFEASNELDIAFHVAVAGFAKPLIAAVNGAAVAGGFDLANMCDIRIASASATFYHPEIKFGAPVLYGALKEIIGGGMARDLCLTGRKIDAAEAYRIGLVSQVVANDSLMNAARKIALTIAEAPSDVLKRVKKRITDLSTLSNWEKDRL